MTTSERNKCNTLRQILGEIPKIQLGRGNEAWSKKKNKPNTMPKALFRVSRKLSKARQVTENTMMEEKAWMYN